MLRETFDEVVERVREGCVSGYGERLVSLALFGSVARGTMRPDSDIDLLVVAAPLPNGRLPRMDEFRQVEEAVGESLAKAAAAGVHTMLSPVIKTPAEVEYGSPLFLDMTDQARILVDRDGFLAERLAVLRRRLGELGARRVPKGGGYYWLLKPDLKPGEDIQL